jgi:integrase
VSDWPPNPRVERDCPAKAEADDGDRTRDPQLGKNEIEESPWGDWYGKTLSAHGALESAEAPPLHECRHTFASLMIAAGVNAKALSSYMGHSSITITFDRYGHLMPGNEDAAAELLDAYLERANTQARLAQLET